VMLVLSIGRPVFPEPDPDFRLVFDYAAAAMWLSDAAFGLLVFRLRAVSRWAGLALALGSVLGFLGMGRLGLVTGEYGWLVSPVALGGIALNGLAWILLGLSLVLAGRWRARPVRVFPEPPTEP
jgi:hypothetical protein